MMTAETDAYLQIGSPLPNMSEMRDDTLFMSRPQMSGPEITALDIFRGFIDCGRAGFRCIIPSFIHRIQEGNHDHPFGYQRKI